MTKVARCGARRDVYFLYFVKYRIKLWTPKLSMELVLWGHALYLRLHNWQHSSELDLFMANNTFLFPYKVVWSLFIGLCCSILFYLNASWKFSFFISICFVLGHWEDFKWKRSVLFTGLLLLVNDGEPSGTIKNVS